VCPLVLALYGHPDSGGYWERHCEKQLSSVGFEPVEEWRSCFWHPKLSLFLVVYVDDFKLSGPIPNLARGWQLIRRHIRTEDPTPTGKYLGCDHRVSRVPMSHLCAGQVQHLSLESVSLPPCLPRGAAPESDPDDALVAAAPEAEYVGSATGKGRMTGKKSTKDVSLKPPSAELVAQTLTWDMSDFLQQCIDLYFQRMLPRESWHPTPAKSS
jgi:hypothetical protein